MRVPNDSESNSSGSDVDDSDGCVPNPSQSPVALPSDGLRLRGSVDVPYQYQGVKVSTKEFKNKQIKNSNLNYSNDDYTTQVQSDNKDVYDDVSKLTLNDNIKDQLTRIQQIHNNSVQLYKIKDSKQIEREIIQSHHTRTSRQLWGAGVSIRVKQQPLLQIVNKFPIISHTHTDSHTHKDIHTHIQNVSLAVIWQTCICVCVCVCVCELRHVWG
eukprot:GHVR01007635.1.p1 GENE.GHVR01007635.1~~GHVR01007635.1.p1  ORF type:complete len:214 (+),score=77.22 GHVR01007635.1:116-757(+)